MTEIKVLFLKTAGGRFSFSLPELNYSQVDDEVNQPKTPFEVLNLAYITSFLLLGHNNVQLLQVGENGELTPV